MTTEENHSTWQKSNPSANYCGFQSWAINKFHRMNHLTKHHWYGSRRPTRILLLTAQHKSLPGLTSLVFNCIDQMDMYDMETTSWIHRSCMSQGTIQAGGDSVMVWGMCSWSDMGPLSRYDSDRWHIGMHLGYSHASIHVHSDGLCQFQQDNATPHSSRIATEWLQEQSSEFKHLWWLPNSPDMNIQQAYVGCISFLFIV
jgi:hypothetical protein